MALALVLHSLKAVPFAPLVTTLQKIVILSFAAWLLCLSAKNAGRWARIVGAVSLCVPVAPLVRGMGVGQAHGDGSLARREPRMAHRRDGNANHFPRRVQRLPIQDGSCQMSRHRMFVGDWLIGFFRFLLRENSETRTEGEPE